MPNLKSFLGVAIASLKSFNAIPAENLSKILGLDVGGTPFSPTDIAGLVYWFKADGLVLNDNDIVASMEDFSGNGYHANEGSDASRPTFKTGIQNGLPVVRFAGSHGRQFGANPSAEESAFDLATPTIFIVAKNSGGTGTLLAKATTSFSDARRRKLHIRYESTTGIRYFSGSDATRIDLSTTNTAFKIYSLRANADNNHDFAVDNVSTNYNTALNDSTFNDARVEIGQAFANGAERLTGDIAEIIVYNSALSDSDRSAVTTYLANKWGIAI